MKKKMNSVAILGIFVLLLLGYGIPTMVAAVEDYSLQSKTKTVEMEKISLNFNNVNLTEELSEIPELLMSNVIVERGKEIETDTQKYTWAKASIEELFQVLEIEQEVEFEAFSVSYYAMMSDTSEENVYPLWKCLGIDADKNEYFFWIDDITGKVAAFEIPLSAVAGADKVFIESLENMGAYYGLSAIGLTNTEEYIYASKYWENFLGVMDEETGKEFYLFIYRNGDRMCFNMYPGTISVYDYDSEISSSSSD